VLWHQQDLEGFLKRCVRCFHPLQTVAEERIEALETGVRGIPPAATQHTAGI